MAGDDNSENMETSQKVELVFNDQEKEWLTQSEEFYGKRKYDGKNLNSETNLSTLKG